MYFDPWLFEKKIILSGLGFRLFADDPSPSTKEKILSQRFRQRYKNYCKNKKDAEDKVKEALKHIFKEISNRVDVEQCAAFCVDQDCNRIDPHFVDKSGYLKCGIIHKREEEIQKQTCSRGGGTWLQGLAPAVPIPERNSCLHQINPFRTWVERELLQLFELDHE